jgi:hypothetical protein
MISVVTAITNGKDKLLDQPQFKDVQYIAFLDPNDLPVYRPKWELRQSCNKFSDPVMNAKIHKILTHKYVDSEYIVWMDGKRTWKRHPHDYNVVQAGEEGDGNDLGICGANQICDSNCACQTISTNINNKPAHKKGGCASSSNPTMFQVLIGITFCIGRCFRKRNLIRMH